MGAGRCATLSAIHARVFGKLSAPSRNRGGPVYGGLGAAPRSYQCQGITPVILGSISAHAKYADNFSTTDSSFSTMAVTLGVGQVAPAAPNKPGISQTDWWGFSKAKILS